MHTENTIYRPVWLSPPAADVPPALLVTRRPALIFEPEGRFKRGLFVLIALAVTAGYGFFLSSYWAPAPSRPGIDENAYLIGGRNFAEHGTSGYKPVDDYQFVGAMWIRTKGETISPPSPWPQWLAAHLRAGWYYPKYPVGVPLLYAVAIKLKGNAAAFAVSPICAVLAVLGMFFLGRSIAGSFSGVLAMIVLATNQNTLELANDPNSHAPALCMVVWGMFLIIRWWQSGGWWRAAAGGFLLGYAVTIRYTEALLLFPLYPLDQILKDASFNSDVHPHLWQVIKAIRLLPIGPLGLAVLFRLRWNRVRSWFSSMIPIVFWAIPVAALVGFNWFSMGHVTGYDATNESVGFTIEEFLRKWDFTLHELYVFGLFMLMPLGVAGLVLMYRRSWRMALMLTMWLVPGALLYTAYYWGLQTPGVGFLRFFLTLFPPLIVSAFWLFRSAMAGANVDQREGSIVGPLAAGLFCVATAGVAFKGALPDMERQHRGNMNLHTSAEHILAKMDLRDRTHQPIVFIGDGMFPQLLQYMQFMKEGDWYTYDAFKVRAAGGMGLLGALQLGKNDPHGPVLLQQDRLEYMAAVMKGKTETDLVNEQHRLIDQGIKDDRPMYAVLTAAQEADFRRQFMTGPYEMARVDHWAEPCNIRFPGEPVPVGSTVPEEKQSPLLPAVMNGEPFIQWRPQVLTMFEIHKNATLEPAVQNVQARAKKVAAAGEGDRYWLKLNKPPRSGG